MNDEPKRLLEEDPDGAASALIRAALADGQGAPPPWGAEGRVAKRLELELNRVAPSRKRRFAAWTAGTTILAAAAATILFVVLQSPEDDVNPTTVGPPPQMAPRQMAPPLPAAAEPLAPSPNPFSVRPSYGFAYPPSTATLADAGTPNPSGFPRQNYPLATPALSGSAKPRPISIPKQFTF